MAQVTLDLTLADGSATPPELIEDQNNWRFEGGLFRSTNGSYSSLTFVDSSPDNEVTLDLVRLSPGVSDKLIEYHFRKLDDDNFFRLRWNMDYNNFVFAEIINGVENDIDLIYVGSSVTKRVRFTTFDDLIEVFADDVSLYQYTDDRNKTVGRSQLVAVEGFYALSSVSFTQSEPENNIIPIAVIGADRNINTNFVYIADISRSYDPNGSPITYSTTLSKPAGSSTIVVDSDTAYPKITPDTDGLYTLTAVVNDGTDYSIAVSQALTSSLSSVLPSKLPQVINGVTLDAVRLGSIPTHSTMNSSDVEYWAWPVDGRLVPNWPYEQYPILLYSTTDHDQNGDGGVFLRVWDKSNGELIVNIDGEDVLNNAALLEWQAVSNLPEFAHIEKKTNPIFVDTGNGFQTETAAIMIVNGEVIMSYHNQGVSLDSEVYSSLLYQVSKYVTGNNGVDFSGINYSGLEYNQYRYAGTGHDGYLSGGSNTIDSIAYPFIGRALHGGGGITNGSAYQYVGSYNGKKWELINNFWLQTGPLVDDPNFSDGTYLLIRSIDNMPREGAYYRATGTIQLPSSGSENGGAYPVEVLLDENLLVVSYTKTTLAKGELGSFDSASVSDIRKVTVDGVTYGFYTGSDNNNQLLGVAKMVEVPYDWTLFTTNAEKTTLLVEDTPELGIMQGVAYEGNAEHLTYYDGKFITNMEMSGADVSGFVSESEITLSEHSQTEIYFDRIGKNTQDPQTIKIGIADAITGSTREIAIVLPASTGDLSSARSEPMQLSVLGSSNDGLTPLSRYVGQSTNWRNNDKDEAQGAKFQLGMRIIPALNQVIFLYGLGVHEIVDITGFDYDTPIKIFGSGVCTTAPASPVFWSLGGIKAYSYTDNAIAVPVSPLLSNIKTADSITLTAGSVAGATGYKYFLDGKEQDNGVFTGLESETEYTVYARASNALGDSAPSTISTVKTNEYIPDNTKPTTPTLSGSTSAQINTEQDVVANSTDDGGSVVYEFTVTPASISYIQDAETLTISTGTFVGNIVVKCRAFDGSLYSDETTFTMAVSNSAQVSTATVTILDIPDGLQPLKLWSEATNQPIFVGSKQFINGVSSFEVPVATGTEWSGRWKGSNAPATGTGIYGVTA